MAVKNKCTDFGGVAGLCLTRREAVMAAGFAAMVLAAGCTMVGTETVELGGRGAGNPATALGLDAGDELSEGVTVVDPGPSRGDFPTDAEWEHYLAHWHEDEASAKYGFPVVEDSRGRRYVPGEITLFADEGVDDSRIREVVEQRGLHVAGIGRSAGVPSLVKVYADDPAAGVDDMCARFEGIDGVTVGGPNGAGMAID